MQRLTRGRRQAGITLIETLIALVVAALGILGVLGMQMRTLADTQTGVRRAQAIRLIEDLGERSRVNPNSLAVLDGYEILWGDSGPTPPVDCSATQCSAKEMSLYDMQQWVALVRQTLPGSTAFLMPQSDENSGQGAADNQRQVVIGIGWRENERSGDADYTQPITGKNHAWAWANSCPAGKTCHFQRISLSSRCAPYFSGGPVQFFCPGQ